MEKAGIECNDILSCIQLTFEHEMIHGIMFCLCRNYMIRDGPGNWKGKFHNKSAHSKTFMSISYIIYLVMMIMKAIYLMIRKPNKRLKK